MEILSTPEFNQWIGKETEKSKAQIDARIKNIELYDYFGDHKNLGDELWELRWKNGRRVYFSIIHQDSLTILLVGGYKNAQKKDIKKARAILVREISR